MSTCEEDQANTASWRCPVAAPEIHPLHQEYIDALLLAESLRTEGTDEDAEVRAWDAEQIAHDAWADAADDLGVCLTCEAPTTTHAYCEECRGARDPEEVNP